MSGVPPITRLHRPVTEILSEYALGQCDAADQAGARLSDPEDAEGLHDFRVAVRRLRSALRAYAHWLPLPKKHRKALGDLARSTNAARDAEVAAAWLAQQVETLEEHERGGMLWIIERLEAEKARGYAEHRRRIPPLWQRLTKQLHKDLGGTAAMGPTGREDFATATATLVLEAADHLERGLLSLEQQWDDNLAHAIRIDGKRLRYLLEPTIGVIPAAEAAVKAMKRFQDDLGDYHDGAVLLEQLPDLAVCAASERAAQLFEHQALPVLRSHIPADPLPGMAATARCIHHHHDELRHAIAERYLGEGRHRLLQSARDCAGQLIRAE